MKKRIAILLLGVLLLLSMVGCLQENTQNVNTTPNATDENTTPNTEVTTPPATDPSTPPAGTPYPIVYTATLFAQPKFTSAVFSVDFNPTENNCFYINGDLYASVGICDNFSVNFESFDEDEQKAAVLEKIKEAESCFVLESQTEKDYMQKIAIYTIDNMYYFLDNYNGVVMRVWRSEQFPLPENNITPTPPSNEEPIVYTAMPFVSGWIVSGVFPLEFKCAENNNFYLNGTLYENIGLCENFDVDLEAFETDEQRTIVLEKIKNAESCFVLEATTEKAYMQKIAIYTIDGVYYFLDNYDGTVIRVWRSEEFSIQ